MNTLAELTKAIAEHRLAAVAPEGEEIPLGILVSLTAAIRTDGESMLHGALLDTLQRIAETQILSHPRITELVGIWPGFAGRHEEIVSSALTEILGVKPSHELVRHVRSCLGGAARHKRSSRRYVNVLPEILDRIKDEGIQELRCQCCGYHFRSKDIGSKRMPVVEGLFELADRLAPGRAGDLYKPVQFGKDSSYLSMNIDHVVPLATLGWSEADNLEILCAFCNFGKLAFRRPLEAISTFAVGALSEFPDNREFSSLKHQIIVATLRAQGGSCSNCGSNQREREMTVRPTTPSEVTAMHGFSPWNIRTLCYPCVYSLDL